MSEDGSQASGSENISGSGQVSEEEQGRLRERLEEIEEVITFLRGELTPPSDDVKDYGDAASEMMSIEELRSQIETLETERDRIRARLGLS